MYEASQAAEAAAAEGGEADATAKADDDVVDADFEEIDEDGKKKSA
jgi:molecular chaperone DnaK